MLLRTCFLKEASPEGYICPSLACNLPPLPTVAPTALYGADVLHIWCVLWTLKAGSRFYLWNSCVQYSTRNMQALNQCLLNECVRMGTHQVWDQGRGWTYLLAALKWIDRSLYFLPGKLCPWISSAPVFLHSLIHFTFEHASSALSPS